MSKFRLTINLYPVDEVISSFKQCILQKKTVRECIFWLWELIYSGENVERLLEEIYLNFYASHNPHLYRYIKMKRKKYYTTNNKRELANIVCNLRLAFSGSDSYLLHYYIENPDLCFPLKIYKKPKWLENAHFIELKQNKTLIPLILSIHYYNLKNISYYLYLILIKNKINIDIIYKELIKYFTFKNASSEKMEYVNKIWSENLIQHNSSFIAMIIVYLSVSDDSKLNKNIKYVVVEDKILDEMEKHYNVFTGNIYYKLKEKRIYATHHCVGPGDYGRFHLCNLTNKDNKDNNDEKYDEQTKITYKLKLECCYYWEYYSRSTLYWHTIFNKYNITFDTYKNIHFQTNELLEDFYEKYGMDFDEQSIETQEKSIHPLYVEKDPFRWFNQLV